MQRGLMSGWESWGEICTDRLRAAAFSSWPRPSGQLEKREAETRRQTHHSRLLSADINVNV